MDSGEAFWRFSLVVYGRNGAADACIELQDQLKLDVNMLLYCLWRASRGHALTDAEIRSRLNAVRDWQSGVIQPLRQLRRRLGSLARREGPPWDSDQMQVLYAQLKQTEIGAERVEQLTLAAGLETIRPREVPPGDQLAADNLGVYMAACAPCTVSAQRDALAVIVHSAFPHATRDRIRSRLDQVLAQDPP